MEQDSRAAGSSAPGVALDIFPSSNVLGIRWPRSSLATRLRLSCHGLMKGMSGSWATLVTPGGTSANRTHAEVSAISARELQRHEREHTSITEVQCVEGESLLTSSSVDAAHQRCSAIVTLKLQFAVRNKRLRYHSEYSFQLTITDDN